VLAYSQMTKVTLKCTSVFPAMSELRTEFVKIRSKVYKFSI
jgi:hypothetical protein